MTNKTLFGHLTRRSLLKTSAMLAGAGLLSAPSILRASEGDTIKIGFHSALTGLETLLGETQVNCFTMVSALSAYGTV